MMKIKLSKIINQLPTPDAEIDYVIKIDGGDVTNWRKNNTDSSYNFEVDGCKEFKIVDQEIELSDQATGCVAVRRIITTKKWKDHNATIEFLVITPLDVSKLNV